MPHRVERLLLKVKCGVMIKVWGLWNRAFLPKLISSFILGFCSVYSTTSSI